MPFDSSKWALMPAFAAIKISLQRLIPLSILFFTLIIIGQSSNHIFVTPIALSLFLMSILQKPGLKSSVEERNQKSQLPDPRKLKELVNGKRGSKNALLVLDPYSMQYIEANKQAQRMLQSNRNQLVGKSPLDISPFSQPNGIASQTLFEDLVDKTLRYKEITFEWTHINRNNGLIPCELNLSLDESLANKFIIVKMSDLSIEKQTAQVQADEHRLLSQKTNQMAALAMASASISSSLDPLKILEIIVRVLTQVLHVQIGHISFIKDVNQGIAPKISHINKLENAISRGHKVRSTLPELNLNRIENSRSPIQFHESGNNEENHELLVGADLKRLLLLPIRNKSGIVAIVELQDTRDLGIFDEHELYLAQTLAQQAANAIENANLFQHTNHQLIELQTLKDVANICSEAREEEELIQNSVLRIFEGFNTEILEFLLLSKDKKKLSLHPSSNTSKKRLGKKDNLLHEGISGRVARTGLALSIADVSQDNDYLMFNRITRSELCVPIKLGQDVIGVINAESEKLNNFDKSSLHFLETLANQIASGIARLRQVRAKEQKARQQKIFNQLSSQISGVLDESRLFNLVTESLHKRMSFEFAAVVSSNSFENIIEIEASEGIEPKPLKKVKTRQINNAPWKQAFLEQTITFADKDNIVADDSQSDSNPNSLLILPINVYSNTKFLLLVTKEIEEFDAEEITSLKTLTDQLTVSLESISLFDSTRRQLQELTVIHAISNAAMSANGETELLTRATEIIGANLFSQNFGFFLLDEHTQKLHLHPIYGETRHGWDQKTYSSNNGLFSDVLENGTPLRIGDFRKEDSKTGLASSALSSLAAPLSASGKAIGLIYSEDDTKRAFSKSDLRLLSTIAGQIGNAIEKLRLYESEKIQRVQAETLQEVATILGGVDELSHMPELILDELNQVVPFESAAIQLVEGDELVITGVAGLLPQDAVGFRLNIDEDKLAHPILFEKKTVKHNDVSQHPDWLTAPGTSKIKSWIGAPLVAHGQCVGILTVDGYNINQFSQEDAQLVSSFAIHAAIAMENARLFRETEDSFSQTVSALANAIDVRDSYTKGHSQRLAELAIATAQELKCDKQAVDDIYWAALLHDIGKIGVPDHILRKPSSLTDEEFEIIKEHPAIGEKIIEPIKNLAHIAPVIRAHQERYDGKGYPDGLKKHDIPLAARIISVADAYVAMTDERVYAEAMPRKEALAELERCSGSQFDPEVIQAFAIAVEQSLPK